MRPTNDFSCGGPPQLPIDVNDAADHFALSPLRPAVPSSPERERNPPTPRFLPDLQDFKDRVPMNVLSFR